MSLRFVFLFLGAACLTLCPSSGALAGAQASNSAASTKSSAAQKVAPVVDLTTDEVAIENQAQQEGLSTGSAAQPTGRYYEIGAPKPVVTDRLSDSEYNKLQKIVNVDKLTEDTAKAEKPKFTKKQLNQLKAAQLRFAQTKKRQELADRQELARKKQIKINFTEAALNAKKARRSAVIAKTLPKKKAIAGKRAPASTSMTRFDNRVGDAETRQAARAEKGLQQEIDPNW